MPSESLRQSNRGSQVKSEMIHHVINGKPEYSLGPDRGSWSVTLGLEGHIWIPSFLGASEPFPGGPFIKWCFSETVSSHQTTVKRLIGSRGEREGTRRTDPLLRLVPLIPRSVHKLDGRAQNWSYRCLLHVHVYTGLNQLLPPGCVCLPSNSVVMQRQ